ncbi:hypothetical protein [Granulicella arctica]|uniref:Uncharacterized protein n=1 Tax=Granulicella arctica TaxID=940613 RepID=A0A7Y9TSN6_9BACT|nr:hypothetical protein [Granulicella arctica]NYF79198.1 hypothetical protein [Granulicella arctica]
MIREERRSRLVVLIVLAMSLLLLLSLAHTATHHDLSSIAFLLAPIFLFGSLDLCLSLWTSGTTNEATLHPSPARPSLFQRPPPALS